MPSSISGDPFKRQLVAKHSMPKIKPFRALRPTVELASHVASVPYDTVNREEAALLAEKNPDSFCM